MDSITPSRSKKADGPIKLINRVELGIRKGFGPSYNHKSQMGWISSDTKSVNKSVGIYKNKNLIKRRGYVDSNPKIQLYGLDSEALTPIDSLDLEIDENILKVCKIYLKQSLCNDCKLVKLSVNYVEHIVELIFNLGFLAKRGHFMRDILDLINLSEVPECMLKVLGMNRNHRLSIFKGICFKANLLSPNMKTKFKKCKVLLIKYFSNMEDENKADNYDSIVNLSKTYKSLENIVEKVWREGVELIACENYVPNDISAYLLEKKITCISKVGSNVMSKLAFALKCSILNTLETAVNFENYTGGCEEFRLLSRGITIAPLTFQEYFKGFTIFISTRMIKSTNLKRIEELIKISIVRLQGIVEELELIQNLDGTFIVDSALCDEDYEQNNICENFSDYLDMLLGNKSRSSIVTSSPRSNLNYFSCDIYYNKIVESEITCNEYRKLTRLQCFQYYTKINELCTMATFETIPIGNYTKGLFLSDFIKNITNSLKINKCAASQSCSESFINHQLHFETAYSNIENMRLSLTFQISSEKYSNEGINMKTFCSVCNHSRMHSLQDLTFGRFLQLILFNKSYRSKCGHLLFFSNKFSVLAENYSITFSLSPVSIYTVCPEFNERGYNCSKDTVEFKLCNETMLDKRLQVLSNRVTHLINCMEYDNRTRPQRRMARNLFFSAKNMLSRGYEYFYNRVYELVNDNFNSLVNYDIERHLPCLCRLTRECIISPQNRSQWVSRIDNITFKEFISNFEKHSGFGIELNYRLYEKLKVSFETGSGVHICDLCGMEGYSTLSDVDILNWFYILVHVIKAVESKILKLKAGLVNIIKYSEVIERFYRCVKRTEEDLIGVLLQCVSLLLYFKHFCPRDPMYLFTIVKEFFLSYYNLFESLLDDYKEISHIDKVSSLKILEYDKTNVIIIHTFGTDAVTYQKIDFMKSTAENGKDTEVEVMKGEDLDEEMYTIYNVDEFLTFSQYFAILSGIQDLSSEATKRSSYFKLVSKIRLKNTRNQSIICVNYSPIIMANRDVANILANTLVSKQYSEHFGKHAKMSENRLMSKYISYMREFKLEYEKYRVDGFGVDSEVRIGKGLCHNYVSIGKVKRSPSQYIFKLGSFPELQTYQRCHLTTFVDSVNVTNSTSSMGIMIRKKLKQIYATNNLGFLNYNDDMVLSMFMDRECLSLVKSRVRSTHYLVDDDTNYYSTNIDNSRRWRCPVPFYGLPIIYTNSKMVNYKDIDEEVGIRYLGAKDSMFSRGSNGYLSHGFVERCIKFDVDSRFLIKKILRRMSTDVTKVIFEKVGTNTLISMESLISVYERMEKYDIIRSFLRGSDVCASTDNGISKNDLDTLDVYTGEYCVTVFYEWEFRKLRGKFCGDEMNFVRSLCRSTRMKSIGKSGSPIFMTYDGKFTIKLINKHEIGLFLMQGKEFFKYFNQNKTLMSLPYGLFKVTHLKTNSSVNCFVMQNIDYFHNTHKISFDLKGISLKRYISLSKDSVVPVKGNPVYSYTHSLMKSTLVSCKEPEYKEHNALIRNGNYVLLDQNFKLYTKGCPIQLDYDSINVINERLKNDLNFLSSINIVDYSLLLRISTSQSIITLGLIDFLRPYTWDKQIETVGKRLANIGQEPTIVSPNEYKTRFFNFIQRIFVYPDSIKTLKESYEQSEEKPSHENINFMYQLKSYKQCGLCRLTKYMYSNQNVACFKYYTGLMSREIVQYLHLVMDKKSKDKGVRSGSSHGSESDYPKHDENGRLDQDRLNKIVNLIQCVYQSPRLNWNLVI